MKLTGEMHAWRGPSAVLIALICAAAQAACTNGSSGEFVVADSAGVAIVSSLSPAPEWLLEPEPVLVLGSLGGGPTEFYQIRDIDLLPDGGIAVANGGTNEIRLFTADGQYVRSAGRKGHGPGEYDGLYWLHVVGDSLLAHDWGNDRVSVLDSTGAYGRSFRLEWHYGIVSPVAVLPDRTLLGFTTRHMVELPHAGLVTDSALLSRYDFQGALVDSIGRFAHNQRVVRRAGNRQTTLGLPFSAIGQVAVSPEGFCYVFGVHSEVRCHHRDGQLTRIARLARDPLPVTGEQIEAYWDRELASRNERRVDALRRMRDVMVFPDFYPAFSDLLVDDQGRIWAQEYHRPHDSDINWDVIRDGRWIASVKVDTAFQLMLIRGDRLLGVWRNELGVETVRAYRLSRS